MNRPHTPFLTVRPDGSVGLVDAAGRLVPDNRRISITARELAQALALHAQAGIAVGRDAGVRRTAAVGARLVQAVANATNRAGIRRGAQAGAEAGVKAGALAGVAAGARHAFGHSATYHKLERDAEGQVIGSLETRVPVPEN